MNMKTKVPVGARGKLVCSFPRTCGRVLLASTGPAASTGSSRLNRLPCPSVFRELLVDVELLDDASPRMIVADAARLDPNYTAAFRCHARWRRRDRVGGLLNYSQKRRERSGSWIRRRHGTLRGSAGAARRKRRP